MNIKVEVTNDDIRTVMEREIRQNLDLQDHEGVEIVLPPTETPTPNYNLSTCSEARQANKIYLIKMIRRVLSDYNTEKGRFEDKYPNDPNLLECPKVPECWGLDKSKTWVENYLNDPNGPGF